MDEIERRLRLAMMAAAEPAPRGLATSVYRRHRRHRRRQVAGYLALTAVLGFAIPPIGHDLRGGPPTRQPPASNPVTPGGSPAARATPGTVLLTCNDANWGQLQSNWRAVSLKAGPVWFVFGRQEGYVHYGSFRP